MHYFTGTHQPHPPFSQRSVLTKWRQQASARGASTSASFTCKYLQPSLLLALGPDPTASTLRVSGSLLTVSDHMHTKQWQLPTRLVSSPPRPGSLPHDKGDSPGRSASSHTKQWQLPGRPMNTPHRTGSSPHDKRDLPGRKAQSPANNWQLPGRQVSSPHRPGSLPHDKGD